MRSFIPLIVAIALALTAGCFGPPQTPRSKSFEADLTKICTEGKADLEKLGHLSDSTVTHIEGVLNAYSEFHDSIASDGLRVILRANSKLTNLRSEKSAAMLRDAVTDELTNGIPTLVSHHLAHVSGRQYTPGQ